MKMIANVWRKNNINLCVKGEIENTKVNKACVISIILFNICFYEK